MDIIKDFGHCGSTDRGKGAGADHLKSCGEMLIGPATWEKLDAGADHCDDSNNTSLTSGVLKQLLTQYSSQIRLYFRT
jgi:hypothetical protein